jgi:hypothetical protein
MIATTRRTMRLPAPETIGASHEPRRHCTYPPRRNLRRHHGACHVVAEMKLSATSKDKLCTLTAKATVLGAGLIGAAHAAYYMADDINNTNMLHQLTMARSEVLKIVALAQIIDGVIDEIEGREPVAVINEQEATR